MGEVADMILEGILCQDCGAFMPGTPAGVPVTCKNCKREQKGQK
jgi:hypothetical protein